MPDDDKTNCSASSTSSACSKQRVASRRMRRISSIASNTGAGGGMRDVVLFALLAASNRLLSMSPHTAACDVLIAHAWEHSHQRLSHTTATGRACSGDRATSRTTHMPPPTDAPTATPTGADADGAAAAVAGAPDTDFVGKFERTSSVKEARCMVGVR